MADILQFAYTYVAAGCFLFIMAILAIVAHTTRWRPWPIIRIGIVFTFALGTALVAVLWYNPDRALDLLRSPWTMPTIGFVYLIVLVITHIHGMVGAVTVRRLLSRFSLPKRRKGIPSQQPQKENKSALNELP